MLPAGPLAGALGGNAVFSSGIGTITCNQSAFAGDVTGHRLDR